MACSKCGEKFFLPKYLSRYEGWPWNKKFVEWLMYECSGCGYTLNTKCKDEWAVKGDK